MAEDKFNLEEDLDGIQVVNEVMTMQPNKENSEKVNISSKPPSWLLISGIIIIIACILVIYFKLRKK